MIWNDQALRAELIAGQKKISELEEALANLGKVVEEQAVLIGQARQEAAARFTRLSDEMTEMESRLMTRIEEIEDKGSETSESDILQETDAPTRGVTLWSERKRARASKEINLDKWKAPPKVAPQETKT